MKVDVTVSANDEYLNRFSEFVKACEKAGLNISQKLSNIGVVTGRIDADRVDLLHRAPGVAHVEQSRSFQIAPPDSKIQ
jgi:hypothetical protein